MFSPCVFVCVCVCVCVVVYVCHDVCPDDLAMKDWCHTNNILCTLLGMSSCASYVSRTHDVIDDVTRSQSRSNFEIDIYLRQYLSYSVDQKLKMSEMLMAIFLVYSTSGITSG